MMNEKKEILEFLADPQNMEFLLELDPLIDEAKSYKYSLCLDRFSKGIITPKIWSGYAADYRDDVLQLVDERFKEDKFFRIFVSTDTADKNNWYGVMGDEKTFDSDIAVVSEFKRSLDSAGIRKRWHHMVAYEYFSRNRSELLRTPIESVDQFFADWAQTFWSFAERIRNDVEKVNMALASQSS